MLQQLHTQLFISPGFLRVIRVLRLCRLLRSIDQAKRIRQLLFTMIKSAPALMNVCAALFLIMFIYAILGMTIFCHVKHQKDIITKTVNFETFGSSMCLLFRLSTSAGWNNVLAALMIREPNCNPNKELNDGGNGVTKGNCGNSIVAVVYFVSYIMIIGWIIISVYVAVLIENFNAAQKQDQIGVTEDGMEEFYDAWQQYDPLATQFIPIEKLRDFTRTLEEPFRLKRAEYFEFFMTSDIPIKEGYKCHCFDVMKGLIQFHLSKRRCVITDETAVFQKLENQFNLKFPARKNVATIGGTRTYMTTKTNAKLVIQRLLRYYQFVANICYLKQIIRAKKRVPEKRSHILESLIKGLLKEMVPRKIYQSPEELVSGSDDDEEQNSTIQNPFTSERN